MGGYWPTQKYYSMLKILPWTKNIVAYYTLASVTEKKSLMTLAPDDAEVCLEAPGGLVTTGDNGIKRFFKRY